jgi:hypothetical protein
VFWFPGSGSNAGLNMFLFGKKKFSLRKKSFKIGSKTAFIKIL